MTRADIIRLAELAEIAAHKELGMPGEFHPDWHEVRDQKFAALVAADEREVCASIIEECCEHCAATIRAMGDE